MSAPVRPEPQELIERTLKEVRAKLAALRAKEEILAETIATIERECELEDEQ